MAIPRSDRTKSGIPWKAPAVLGRKRRNDNVYVPELAGLTLNEALEHAIRPTRPTNDKPCIWVNWKGREIVLHQGRINKLAARPDRPPLLK